MIFRLSKMPKEKYIKTFDDWSVVSVAAALPPLFPAGIFQVLVVKSRVLSHFPAGEFPAGKGGRWEYRRHEDAPREKDDGTI